MVDDPRALDIWRITYFFAMLLSVVVLALRFRKRLGWPTVIVWGYFLISSLTVFMNPFSYAWGIPLQLDQTAGQAFSELIMVPLMVLSIPKTWFHRWKTALVIVACLDVLSLFIFNAGVMIAPSFDAAFIAMVLPVAGALAALPMLIGIIYAKGATAFLVLLIQGLGVVTYFKKINWQTVATILGVIAAALAIGYHYQGHEMFEPTGRLNAWSRYMGWWDVCANHIFGTGIGTFMWISPYTKIFGDNAFLHMHNDWLQVLFEGGTIGFFLLCAYGGYLLGVARSRPYHFVMLCGLFACMLTYHPLHFFFTSFFACCLARDILYETPIREHLIPGPSAPCAPKESIRSLRF